MNKEGMNIFQKGDHILKTSNITSSYVPRTYHNLMAQANYLSALLLAFWLPFSRNFITVFIGLWVLTWLLEGDFINRFKYNKLNKYQITALSLPIFLYLLHVLSYFYSENKDLALFDLEVKFSMLLFPLLTFGTNKFYRLKRALFLKVFIAGLILSSMICIGVAFYKSLNIIDGNLVFQTAISPHMAQLNFFQLIGKRFSTFSYTHFSIFHHPAYFAMYLNFGIVSSYYLYRLEIKKCYKSLYLSVIVFFSIIIFLLSSRAGLVSLFIVYAILMFIEILLQRKNLVVIISLVLFVCIGAAVVNSKLSTNIKPVIEYARQNLNVLPFFNHHAKLNEQENNEKSIKEDVRIVIWRHAFSLAKEKPLTGVGIGDVRASLFEKYREDNFVIGIKKYYNAHNQYIELLIAGGFLMLISLLLFLFFGIYMAILHRRYMLGSLMFLLILNLAFESMLNTMAGTIFIMFFYSLLVRFDIKQKTIKQVKQELNN